MNPTLSVGIVVHNHERYLEATVRSVLDNLPEASPSRVWILDNRSDDQSLSIARRIVEHDARVSLIANGTNAGYGSGNNRILERVESTYHVVCNPDIVVTEGAFAILLDFLETHPDVAIACPRVHFEDGRLQALNRRHPTVWDLFLRRFMPQKLAHKFSQRMEFYEMLDMGYDASYDVPFVSGAFMACRTEVLRPLGGFDERYFLYFEDVDLCRALQQQGWRTTYCPDAVVIHGWQREAHRNYRGMLRFSTSAFRYFNKWGWRLY